MVAPTQPGLHPAAKCGLIAANTALAAGLQAGIGALTALALTAISPALGVIPAVGAIFGAVMGGTTALTISSTSPGLSLFIDDQTMERFGLNKGHRIPFIVAQTALAIILGTVAATAFTMSIGLPITFAAVAIFTAVPLVMMGIQLAIRGCVACASS